MSFITKLFKIIPMLPALILGIENLFKGMKGDQKQASVIDFVGTALNFTEAVANKDIVDNDMFQEGLKQANDGIVKMLNASIWAKK
jgi:hypothetical protein